MTENNKMAIVVGHTEDRGGALAFAPLFINEFHFNTMFVKIIKGFSFYTGIDVEIFYRTEAGILECYSRVTEYAPITCFELHFNAAADERAKGCETWYYEENYNDGVLAEITQDRLMKFLPFSNRGIKDGSKDRAGTSTGALPSTANVLVEPFFGSNKFDCKAAIENIDRIALAILSAHIFYVDEQS